MSHNYFSATVPFNSTEAQIKKAVVSSCYGYNGERERMMSDIASDMSVKIIKGCYTEQEARDLLDSNDDFFWSGFIKAVPFCYSENKKTKDFERRIYEAKKKKSEYIANHRVADQKAAFIGCPECKSKINRSFYEEAKRRNAYMIDYCPVCRADMLSETAKKTLKGYNDKIIALSKDLEAEKKRLAQKPTHYLAMCGIHD